MSKITNGPALERLLEPVSSSLNEDAARKLVVLKANRKAQARVSQLARKCNEGVVSAAERREYEAYVMAGEIIGILQASAESSVTSGSTSMRRSLRGLRPFARRSPLRVPPSP
jgi:hypothetical protein